MVHGRSFLTALTLVALVTLAASGCAHGKGEEEPDQPVVKGIRIDGAKKLDEDEIKKKILTTETPWWGRIWPFHTVHYFDPNAWQADLRRIERYYQAQGYYQAQVTHQEVNPDGDDGVRLQVQVQEGQPTTISSLEIRGLESLPREHQDAALKDLPLRQGAVFHEEDWAGLKQKMQSALREHGYAEAKVEGEVAVDVVSRQAEVHLEAAPGQRYRFGTIFVTQDDRPMVPAQRILEQAEGAIHVDDWYSESALAEAQARVFKMGVFGGVKVNRGAPDRLAAAVPVVVDVREAPFHLQKLGGGVGVDPARNEARVLGEYTDRNFFGDLRRLTLRAKVGYAFVPSLLAALAPPEAQLQEPRSGLLVDGLVEVEQPRFLFRDVRAQATLGVQKGIEQGFDYLEGRTRLGAIWQPWPELSIFPSYNVEVYSLSGALTESSNPGSQGLGCVPDPSSSSCHVVLSYVELTLEYDRRDDRIEPRDGYYAALSLQGGGELPVGDFNYFRFQPEVRFYKTFQPFDRLTLAARLKQGTLVPLFGTPQTPLVVRFYSGGSSMRGFSNRRLSPLLVVPSAADPARTATIPVGGDGLFESSVELRYRPIANLTLAAFLDMGFVTKESFDYTKSSYVLNNTMFAVGIGARYLTPVGPIRVDLARRLDVGGRLELVNPQLLPEPAAQPGCFGLFPTSNPNYGGWPEGQCAFHLSIGEAF